MLVPMPKQYACQKVWRRSGSGCNTQHEVEVVSVYYLKQTSQRLSLQIKKSNLESQISRPKPCKHGLETTGNPNLCLCVLCLVRQKQQEQGELFVNCQL
eukprot:scaffold300244_cov31-Tisochrysis_lutea.AAC.1